MVVIDVTISLQAPPKICDCRVPLTIEFRHLSVGNFPLVIRSIDHKCDLIGFLAKYFVDLVCPVVPKHQKYGAGFGSPEVFFFGLL